MKIFNYVILVSFCALNAQSFQRDYNEELRGEPHEIIAAKTTNQKEQLWVYFLNDKKLELSFKDFILFKIEEI